MKGGSTLALVVPWSLLVAACGGYDNGDRHSDGNPRYETVAQSPIDLNGTFAPVTPGQGVGLFIEYGPEGNWHVFTSCDMLQSHAACQWDVLFALPTGERVTSFQPENLESEDYLAWQGEEGEFAPITSTDLDGMRFVTTPGQPLRVEAYLDSQDARQFMFWLSGGAANHGASTNPIDLIPGPAVGGGPVAASFSPISVRQ